MTSRSRLTYSHTLTPAEMAAAEALQEQELSAGFAEGPCYGLADWAGTRMVRGSSRGPDGFRHIELSFEDPQDPRRSVAVLTVVADRFTIKIGELRRRADIVPVGDYETLANEPAEEITVLVDDRPNAFRLWRDDGYDVAAGSLGGRGVVLGIRGVPSAQVRLVRVADLDPFLAGTRALTARRRDEANGT